MTTAAPPGPPEQQELQALIEEARRRARRRRAGYTAAVILSALLAAGVYTLFDREANTAASRAGVSHPDTCSRSDWRLLPPGLNGATGAILSGAAVRLQGPSSCRLNIAVTFSVQRETENGWRTLPNLRGNPAQMRFDVLLRRGNPVDRTWSWRDYCAGPGRFRFHVTATGRSASTTTTPPACEHERHTLPSSALWRAGGLAPFPPR